MSVANMDLLTYTIYNLRLIHFCACFSLQRIAARKYLGRVSPGAQ